MILDDGMVEICQVSQIATPGRMPAYVISHRGEAQFYGERTVGYGRQYAAMGVSQQVDKLIRIWQDRSIRIGMVAILDECEQYRIDNIQHLDDENGLGVTHLTLRRLDRLYDIADEA